jgi:hypothetical protein
LQKDPMTFDSLFFIAISYFKPGPLWLIIIDIML